MLPPTGTMLPPTAYGGMRIPIHCGRHPSTDVADCGKRATSSMQLRFGVRECALPGAPGQGDSIMVATRFFKRWFMLPMVKVVR